MFDIKIKRIFFNFVTKLNQFWILKANSVVTTTLKFKLSLIENFGITFN